MRRFPSAPCSTRSPLAPFRRKRSRSIRATTTGRLPAHADEHFFEKRERARRHPQRLLGPTARRSGARYRFEIFAEGRTFRGRPFTREATRTAAVWLGGDRPPPSVETDPNRRDESCVGSLRVSPGQKRFVAALARAGVDVAALRKCLAEFRGRPPRRSYETGTSTSARAGTRRYAPVRETRRLWPLTSSRSASWPVDGSRKEKPRRGGFSFRYLSWAAARSRVTRRER
jgi:hypothetical protein